MMNEWKGKHVLVIGAARQGLALSRYLSSQGAVVTLNDNQPEENKTSIRKELAPLSITCVFGSHPVSLLEKTDLVCVSGGVPLDLPILKQAKSNGVPLSNDSQIFFDAVKAPVIGITGSAGKTTTTTLVGRMAQLAHLNGRKVWVGGNIGNPLLESVGEIEKGDLVILELSSFQLELMSSSPKIAVVLNVTPNHLDRHGTMKAYTAAKANILTHQTITDIAVLNREDNGSWNLNPLVKGKLTSFGQQKPLGNLSGSYIENNHILYLQDGKVTELLSINEIELKGEHNLMNVLAACAIAFEAGLPLESIRKGINGFKGVPHRLELVREIRGVCWYNDSIATAPERTSAAIHSFTEPIVLMLGGRDKDLPWNDLAELIHQRVEHVVVFGELGEKVIPLLGDVKPGQKPATLTRCQTLQVAVEKANEVAKSGDVVLFSPGGTSFDAFKDFEERGEIYKSWVNQLT
jgi:UDP-N-acetylmuramoylalanine--D-glutamate ligase